MACLSMAVVALMFTGAADGAALARDGQPRAVIVVGAEPALAEETAARELGEHLQKVTGAEFETVGEEAPRASAAIYVGWTGFAEENGVDVTALGPEEWVIKSVGDDLLLAGGRPRGTLYAAYHFLEDVVGVHWWNAYTESVPDKPTLDVGKLDLHGEPTFRYRDIYMLYAEDGGHFAARNRLNRQGDRAIAGEYGGDLDYGPPYHVHTFYLTFPPEQYFDEHPEWYSLIDGERKAERHQLCLTNQQLREAYAAKLRGYIESSRAEAEKAGVPPPAVFSVSQNDWAGQCQCEACQAIAEREESEAGPLLDFLNYLADDIAEDYPEVYISTLAYQYTQKAPRTIRPRDNIIIRLCDTTSNFTRSIAHPQNKPFREHLRSWARVANNLRVWDYAVNYGNVQARGLPMPTAHTYAVDYRFYAANNVEGVFTEHEYPILADLRDLKVWLMMRMLEDPEQDYGELVRAFTDGFYGPAAERVMAYLSALEAASEEKNGYLSMAAAVQKHRFLDFEFIRRAQAIFDEAEQAVGDQAEPLARVRHARLPLDRATLALYPRLIRQWVGEGNAPEDMPIDRDEVGERCRETWLTEITRRIPAGQQAAERETCEAQIASLTARKPFVPIPERFRGLPPGSVLDYTADMTRNWNNQVKVAPDEGSESGITNRLDLSDEDMEKYGLPMPWGIYDTVAKTSATGTPIRAEDVPGSGYHWYRMGRFKLVPSHYMYFFWSWIIQLDLTEAAGDGEVELWANIRFEGPGFPHGEADVPNAICVERIVVVKGDAGG